MSIRVAAALLAATVTATATATAIALPMDAAADEGPSASTLLSPDSRVRGVDDLAGKVLRAAVACSPTVARMVVDLQASDLIVGIETRPLNKKMLGELRIVAAAGGVRYLRVRLRTPNTFETLMSVLGHELQHAIEVAAAHEVRDSASQRAFYLRVGYERIRGGLFETDAALEAGRAVANEIAGCRVAPGSGLEMSTNSRLAPRRGHVVKK